MTDNRLIRLATEPVGKLLWEYSLPAVVGMMVMSLYNIIDRVFIGRGVGAEAISGLAITFPVMNLSAAIGVLIGAGAAARTSIMLGSGDDRSATMVLGNALTLTLVNASVYLLIFAVFLDEILRAFGASDATLPYAHDFMVWMLPGMLMMNLTFSFNNVMRSSGYPVRAMVTMFIGAALNVALAPVFIFALDMGIKGAAIATDISMTVSMIFVMAHFLSKKSTVHFTRGTFRPRWRIFVEIVSIGAAPSLVNAAGCCINILINRSLAQYGSDLAVGAAGIFTTYTSLFVTFVVGLCMGMQPIIGYNYGAGKIHRLKRTFLLATAVSTAICTAGCVFGLMYPELIAKVFTISPELIEVTVYGLRHGVLLFFVVGFQIVATNLFQSIGKAWKSIILSLVRQVLFLIPLLMVMPPIMGLRGVWLSFPASDFFATVVTLILVIGQLSEFNKIQKQHTEA